MLYIMSTTIVPASAVGAWEVVPITLTCAQRIVKDHPFVSAVGHESTAQVMTELLGADIPMARLTVEPEVGDRFLCFKLDNRPPEGAILDRTTLEALGFSWVIMQYKRRSYPEPVDNYGM